MAFTQARIEAAVDASVSGATHVQLHTTDPGSAGTTNPVSGLARSSITWGTTASSAKSGTASFTIAAAGGPFTHVSLWSASTSGTHYGSAALSPAETFAGAGTLGVTLTVSGQSS